MKTLKELLKRLNGKIPDGERVYAVKCGADTWYTTGKSPGQAALDVCEVARVKDKEIIAAAVAALGELAKEKA